jgi:ABC-type phosphate/phosphonate transport system substrate-binding protein
VLQLLKSQYNTMHKLLLFGFLICGFSMSISAQNAVAIAGDKHNETAQTQSKLGIGQSLTIAPNPVHRDHAELTVTAVGVEYYSYMVVTASGQIVELENLSGKPDSGIIDLTGAVNPGLHIIVFETNTGKVTRKFNVI